MSSVEDVFAQLNRGGVRYVLIGGLASILHGVPRTTIDIDIAVEPSRKNIVNLVTAMEKIHLEPEVGDIDEIISQGGVTFTNDISLDTHSSLKKLAFKEIWKARIVVEYNKIRVPVISKEHQIILLKAVGREEDLKDLEFLTE